MADSGHFKIASARRDYRERLRIPARLPLYPILLFLHPREVLSGDIMRTHRSLISLSFGLFLMMASAGVVRADEVYGRIRGTVTDPTGAVMPGVEVAAINVATGVRRSANTTTAGTFELINLTAPATYHLTAEHSGFKRYEVRGIALSLNQIFVLNVLMELGHTSQHVTVEANPMQVEMTSMQMGARITGNAVVTLPLNGRNWVDLQKTLPGVVESMGDYTRNFSTNGARAQDNGFMVNGTDSNDLALNVPPGHSQPRRDRRSEYDHQHDQP
jgi:multisubunit Na+/H+ antiporter MnhG subunit